MIQAKWIDQALFEPAFINGNWLVHSVFQHSFNLQDPRQDQLICVSKQAARVPKGMILAADDYAALATGLVAGTTLLVQQRVIHFPHHRLSFQKAAQFTTTFPAGTVPFDRELFWSTLQNVTEKTGIQEAVSATIRSNHPFYDAIDQLCKPSFKEQRQAVAYLVGRGVGLTPTGDDMLVGHLLARRVMGQEDTRLVAYLQRRLLTVNDLTTDVSKHYLLHALTGAFNQSALSLTKCTDSVAFSQVIKEILAIGHTSGADFLAGFARSIDQFQNNRNEEFIWQNEWSSL